MTIDISFRILVCILMLIDTYQTILILKTDGFIEANPIINMIHKTLGIFGVLFFKIGIAIAPLAYFEVACAMFPIYTFIVYHNYTGFRNYENHKNIH